MGNSPHTIRLRGAWEYRVLEAEEGSAGYHRIDLHDLTRLHSLVGTLELVRHFNKPTGLQDGDRVELVIGPSATVKAIDLNGRSLARTSGELRFDITTQLQPHNILRIVIDTEKRRNTQLDEVRLEIQS